MSIDSPSSKHSVKPKTYKEKSNEDTRGKRRFLERLEQTRLANLEIEDYENSTDGSDFNRLDGLGSERGERGEGKLS